MNRFNAKEFDAETGNYYYGARYYSPKYNLMLSVDQMYDLYPSFSPYAYTLQNPIIHTDPTGMVVEPIYDNDGNHLANTKEGFIGEVLIYDSKGGPLPDFENMTADEAKQWGAETFDSQIGDLSNDAKSNVWTHIISQMEGQQIYDETFSMNDLTGGKIHFGGSGNWSTAEKDLGKGKGTIYGSGKYIYETTVENIQSSVIIHEWYSHIKKGQGGDNMKSHRLAFKNVINFKALWNNTTEAYKGYNVRALQRATKEETFKPRVAPLYRNLYNKYYLKY